MENLLWKRNDQDKLLVSLLFKIANPFLTGRFKAPLNIREKTVSIKNYHVNGDQSKEKENIKIFCIIEVNKNTYHITFDTKLFVREQRTEFNEELIDPKAYPIEPYVRRLLNSIRYITKINFFNNLDSKNKKDLLILTALLWRVANNDYFPKELILNEYLKGEEIIISSISKIEEKYIELKITKTDKKLETYIYDGSKRKVIAGKDTYTMSNDLFEIVDAFSLYLSYYTYL